MTVPLLLGTETVSFKGKSIWPMLGMAAAEAMVFFTESYGILHTNATFAGVMVAVTPIVAMVLAALVLKEYPTRRQTVFCMIPVLGVIITVLAGSSLGIVTPIGALFLAADCLSMALYRLFNRWSARQFSTFERTYVVLLSCFVVFTVSALVSVRGDVGAFVGPLTNPRVVLPVLALCLLCSIGANMFVNYAAGRMSVTKMSVFSSLITLCSTFGGIVILGEPFSVLSLVGTALIVYGIWQVSRPEGQKE
jgi:drug/metabolite transporter (DMT)-like permease